MSLTKVKLIDLVNVDEWTNLTYRETARVFDDDGSLLAERFHRTPVECGAQKTGHPAVVKDIMDALHTQARIDAWEAEKARLRVTP